MAYSISLCIAPQPKHGSQLRCVNRYLSDRPEWVLQGLDNPRVFIRERVKELAHRQEALQLEIRDNLKPKMDLTNATFKAVLGPDLLTTSYYECRDHFLAQYDPFHFGSLFLDLQKQKAIWAIWGWGRRGDDMVDGFNGSYATHEMLDRVVERIEEVYHGRPRDIYDVALVDTVSRFPVDILLFKDVMEGTRVDLENKRFENIGELNLYRYHISSAFLLMLIQVFGIAPESTAPIERVYDGMVTLGIALTWADTIRDISQDAKIGKIFFPQDELKLAGISEDDIFKGKVTDKWRDFMRQQIKEAKQLLDEGCKEINELNVDARLPLWTSVLVYKQDLDVIEANDYDCFSKRYQAGKARSIASLVMAYAKSMGF